MGFGLALFRFEFSSAGLQLLLLGSKFCLSRGERPFPDRHLLGFRAEGFLEGG